MDLEQFPALHKRCGADVLLCQYDDKLIIYPASTAIKTDLTIRQKKIEVSERTKSKRGVVFDKVDLFVDLPTTQKPITITYQGFSERVLKVIIREHKTFYFVDERLANSTKGEFPKPRLDLMGGFRFSQRDLLTTALLKDASGLIGAPTRFGKTALIINTLRAYPTLSILVVAPGTDLIKQLYDDITGPRGVSDREVRLYGAGRRRIAKPGGITVCSADSVHHIDPGSIDLVLADEPHALVTEDRLSMLDRFHKARRIGFGATLKGRFDGRDKLIEGTFGPVLAERTYKEAVAEGAICPLHVLFLKVEVQASRSYYSRDDAYNSLLFHSRGMAGVAAYITNNIIPRDFQTMIFIKDEKQAELFRDKIGRDTTIAMAKRMSKTEREECNRLMKENIIKRCLCTKIYVQGVTFSDVRVLINMEAGGNNTSAIQKPGRLAEIRPGKKCGIVIDILFVPPNDDHPRYMQEPWYALCRDSMARKAAYEEKGYDITEIENYQHLKEKFNELI